MNQTPQTTPLAGVYHSMDCRRTYLGTLYSTADDCTCGLDEARALMAQDTAAYREAVQALVKAVSRLLADGDSQVRGQPGFVTSWGVIADIDEAIQAVREHRGEEKSWEKS